MLVMVQFEVAAVPLQQLRTDPPADTPHRETSHAETRRYDSVVAVQEAAGTEWAIARRRDEVRSPVEHMSRGRAVYAPHPRSSS